MTPYEMELKLEVDRKRRGREGRGNISRQEFFPFFTTLTVFIEEGYLKVVPTMYCWFIFED